MSAQGNDEVFGPIQLLAIAFEDGADVEARVVGAVNGLQGRGVLRLLDVLLLGRDDHGTVTRVLMEDGELGDLLSRVAPPEDAASFALLAHDEAGTRALAESLAPGGLLMFLLVEHRWAGPLFDAIAETGGVLVDDGFMGDRARALLGAEIAAFEEAAEGIASAAALEAEAALRASAAVETIEDAEEAVAEAVRTVAAADAASALIGAGLIEEAVREEAADAIAAADRAADVEQQLGRHEPTEAATAAPVTPAEMRVLRYLPTGITFAAIASELGISRSAAKERAERAYKRLGVHNRSDAVARARELGLIPE